MVSLYVIIENYLCSVKYPSLDDYGEALSFLSALNFGTANNSEVPMQ